VPDSDLVQLARDVDARCRLRGQFTLRSGQVSGEYFDKYLFESDPVLLRRVVARMAALIPAGTDLLGGLELGGVPLATVLSGDTGLPALFIRKEAKAYGTRQLEDVITTGGAVRNAARALRASGATVTTVVCAIDRSAPGEDPLGAAGIVVRPVLTKALLDSVTSAS
jgi:orotate phosphoribosyltransferase